MQTSIPCVNSVRRRPASLPMTLTAAAAISACLLADMLAAAQPAAAQQSFGNFFTYQAPRRHRPARKSQASPSETAEKSGTKAGPGKEAEKSGPTPPVYVIVSLGDQHATVYGAKGVVTRTRVSTGQPGHRTPTGVFSIIGKERWHRSNIYSGAPMPWMQRITWSGVAMHAGVVPGYPASHGCIRLPAGFAPQLYGMTKMGARVVVAPRDVAPVEFSHPLLPLPKMYEAPVIPASPAQQASRAASVELASADPVSAKEGEDAASGSTKLLDPIAYATALKRRATAEKAAADLAAKNALAAAQAAGAEARQASEDVYKAELELKASEAKLAAVEARLALPAAIVQTASAAPAAGQPATAPSAEVDKAAAESEVTRARAALTEARARESTKSPAAFAAVEAWKRAAATSKAADDLVGEADRRREQVSIFVSRKEGRIFVRQAWKNVWEAPVAIRDPERPLGTHVYTAVEPAPDGSSMRWTAISMPPETPAAEGRRGRGKDKSDGERQEPSPPAFAPETAAGALDRIELPEGAREKIAELLWTGGSLIVSDQPRSYEMSDNETDFIVLTR